MATKSLANRRSYLEQLLSGEGEVVVGDMPLLFVKASLESGISYAAGYPGSPTAAVMDVLSRANEPVLEPLGVYFENSISERSAAAKLFLSIHAKVRGFVNWKVVGTNAAADVLAHVASSGVTGGCVVLVGEDEECQSTTVEMKSLMYGLGFGCPVLDPIPEPDSIHSLAKEAYELSEAAGMPVFFLLRTLAGNSLAAVRSGRNRRPEVALDRRSSEFPSDPTRLPITPDSQRHGRDKVERRLPAAVAQVRARGLNRLERGRRAHPFGIVTHGGVHAQLQAALADLSLLDEGGTPPFDVLTLNVIHPLDPEEIGSFLAEHPTVLIVEQGSPAYLEDAIRALAQRAGLATSIAGKSSSPSGGPIPPAGGLTVEALVEGIGEFLGREPVASMLSAHERRGIAAGRERRTMRRDQVSRASSGLVPARPPVFCSGCPERPVYTFVKRLDESLGPSIHLNDVGCYVMAKGEPFSLSDSCLGMTTALDAATGVARLYRPRVIAFMGDGTFFHGGVSNLDNALSIELDRAVGSNTTFVLFLNYTTAMTGHQRNAATSAGPRGGGGAKPDLEKIVRAHGARHVRTVSPFDYRALREALESSYRTDGLKVIVVDGECTLERERHDGPARAAAIAAGRRVEIARMKVDPHLCNGCLPCERYSGCPSVSLEPDVNPLRDGMTKTTDATCTGCGLCTEVTQGFGLCPAMYDETRVANAGWLERVWWGVKRGLIQRFLQGRAAA